MEDELKVVSKSKQVVQVERYNDYRIFQGYVNGVRELQSIPGIGPKFQPFSFEIKIPLGRGYFTSASITGPKLKRQENGEVRTNHWDQATRVYRPGEHHNKMPAWLERKIRLCCEFVWREERLAEMDARQLINIVRKKGYHKSDNERVRKAIRGYTTAGDLGGAMSEEGLRKAILRIEYPGLVR